MNRISTFRAAVVALVPMVAIALGGGRAGAIAGAVRFSESVGIPGSSGIPRPGRFRNACSGHNPCASRVGCARPSAR